MVRWMLSISLLQAVVVEAARLAVAAVPVGC
jgi:hypothetical protein